MKMYIANCKMQTFDFQYRMLETGALRMRQIEPGQQIEMSEDMSQPEIDHIVKQHARYGLVDAREIKRGQPLGLVYSIGRKMDVDSIRKGIAMVEHNLERQGEENRRAAAVAIDQNIKRDAERSGFKIAETNIEIEEKESEGKPDTTLNERINVSDHNPSEPQKSSRPPKRGK